MVHHYEVCTSISRIVSVARLLIKVKVIYNSPYNGPRRPRGGVDYSSTLSLTSVQDGGGWSTPRPGRFTPGKDPVPIV